MDLSSLNKLLCSIRDFKKDQVAESVLSQMLEDALLPSFWSNTHSYYLAIAMGNKYTRKPTS
jgi:hypothetical protein